METKKLYVRMLGECSIASGEVRIVDRTRRPSKSWLLLAYLLCNRGRHVSQEDLIERLWGNEAGEDYSGALKTTLWRARLLLEPLGPAFGHELILCKDGCYEWNQEIPIEMDTERFETLCEIADAAVGIDAKQENYRAALSLYEGEFLGKFSSESWVEPVAAYYYNLYIEAVQKLLSLLPTEAYAQEIVDRSSAALRTSPYQESLYQYLMRGLMALQEFEKAAEVYEEMRELLFTHLGVIPNETSQAIHAEIRCHICAPYLTLDVIREDLREKDAPSGAFFCDYSVFKLFYRAEARSASRRGDAVHVGILSVGGANEKKLSQNSLERAMEQLREKIRCGVRRGDIVSRCSASQYVILLLQANYENSNMVCMRVARSFAQAYPHSPARIHCSVLPLEPLPGYVPHGK